MRRITITVSAAVMALSLAPAAALARHGHHQRGRHHARIERIGDTQTGSTNSTSSTAGGAGTVQSFANGVLTITLNDGSTVSGAVTSDTEIECASSTQSQSQTTHDEGDGGPGDDAGNDQSGGSQSSGNDESQGDDQGEDDGSQNSCTTANLTPGTVVQGAELRISSTGNVFQKVELAP